MEKRGELDDTVSQAVRTGQASQSQNPAPAKRPQLEIFRRIYVLIFPAFQYLPWLATWLLTRFRVLNWMSKTQIAKDSEAESASTFPELRTGFASPDVTVHQERHTATLIDTAFSNSSLSWQRTSHAGRTRQPRSVPFIGSLNFISGNPPAVLDSTVLQDLLSSGLDRHVATSRLIPHSSPERTSVITLNAVGNTKWLPDLDVYAVGSNPANLVNFIAKLDTGADVCVLSEKVAARFGLDQINRSDRPDIEVLAEKGTKPIGRIDLEFRLSVSQQWYRTGFYVFSDTIVRDKFDALFSQEIIRQMDLLRLGPVLNGLTVQNEHLDSTDHARIALSTGV
jgi:hypothetical protein